MGRIRLNLAGLSFAGINRTRLRWLSSAGLDSAASTWLGKSRLERTKLVGLGQDGCGTLCSAGQASACLSWARVGSCQWNSLPLDRLEQIRLGTGGARLSWTGFGLAELVSAGICSAEK